MLCEPNGGPEALKQGTEEARAVSDGGDLSFRGCFTTSTDILGHPSWAWNEVMLLALMCRGQGILLIYRTIPTEKNYHANGADVEKLQLLTNEAE